MDSVLEEGTIKLIFFVTEDWYFCSHRLVLARAAVEAGWDVAVVTRVQKHAEAIKAAGLRLIELPLNRRGINPLGELRCLRRLWSIYRRERPDLVHHVALKPILYGTLAARLSGVPSILNAFAGLGHLFLGRERKHSLLKKVVLGAMRLLMASPSVHVLFQNQDDQKTCLDLGLAEPGRTSIVRGSGVDTEQFTPDAEKKSKLPLVVLVGRMLTTKGVEDFVQAAESLRKGGCKARFALVGDPDPMNPASIAEATLSAWQENGVVEYWGRRTDIADIYQSADIAVLPSFREGLPKSLLEAAACGLPMVSYDVPGCREVVHDQVTGLLVPFRDKDRLTGAIRELLENNEKRRQLGSNARELVEKELSISCVTDKTLALYNRLVTPGKGAKL